MKIYADRPARFIAQVTADLLAIAWSAAWIWLALTLYDILSTLTRPGELMASAGDEMSQHMGDAAERVREVPLAGDSLAAPFTSVGEAGSSLGEAGRSFQESATTLAVSVSLLAALLPVLLVLVTWLPARARWIRHASGLRRLRAMAPEARERLLALRALSSLPPGRLVAVHDDPAGAWHAGDSATIQRLAMMELRRLGVRGSSS